MASYKIMYYKSKGNSPIDQFLNRSDKQVRDKCLRQIGFLKEYGISRDIPRLKKLKGYNYYEARTLGKDNIRIFCFQRSQVIYITHIFRKKSQKTSAKDLQIGATRMNSILTLDI